MSNFTTEDNVFEVENIIASRLDKDGQRRLFRVRWKGCKSDEDTWEPLENLLSCNELLKQYKEEHRKKKSLTRKIKVTTDSSTQFVLSKIKEEPIDEVETAQIYKKLQNNAKNQEKPIRGFTRKHQLQMEVASEESKKLSTAFSEDSVLSNTLTNVTSKTKNERIISILDNPSDDSLKSPKLFADSTISIENIFSYSFSNSLISLGNTRIPHDENNSPDKGIVLQTIVSLKECSNLAANDDNKQIELTPVNEDVVMEENVHEEHLDESDLRHDHDEYSGDKNRSPPSYHAVVKGKLDCTAALLKNKVNYDSKNSMGKTTLDLANENSTTEALCSDDLIKKRIVTHHCKNTFKNNIQFKNNTSENPFKCTYCDYKTVRKNDLTKHTRIHTGEKPFKCIYCDYKCIQKHNLILHLTHHTGEKPYKCTYCEYKTGSKFHLTKHLKVHNGKKPFKCTYCDYKCIRKETLTMHLFNHTGVKPFKCTYCDYESIRKESLTIHLINHTGVKPFKCSHCDYKAGSKSHLTRHNQIHTGEEPFKCTYCDFKSRSKCHLTNHFKIHTGDNLKKMYLL